MLLTESFHFLLAAKFRFSKVFNLPREPDGKKHTKQTLIAWRDAQEMYRLFLADKEACGGGKGWEGLGGSLPCMVFRTLYKAKRYEEASVHLYDALAAKK